MNQVNKRICITIDDIPGASFPSEMASNFNSVVEINTLITDTLVKYKCPAIGFVSPHNTDFCAIPCPNQEAISKIINIWLSKGLEIGNHTDSHLKIHKVELEKYLNDVIEAEKYLKPELARYKQTLRYFRHPYLRTGQDLDTKMRLAEFLCSQNYITAPVTIDAEDWVFAQAYAKAHEIANEVQKKSIIKRYLDFTEKVLDFSEALSNQIFGYNISHTLLIHNSYLHSQCLEELLDLFLRRAYSFISLEEALSDQAYQRRDPYFGLEAPSWLQRWGIDTPLGFVPRPKEPSDLLEIACQKPV